jgi:leucyl aminopeptidase (aminopeptidase T)
MKPFLETLAENMILPTPSNIVVQFWGEKEDAVHLESFVDQLALRHTQVTGVLFDKVAIIMACESGPYTIQDQINDEALDCAKIVIDLCAYSPTSLVAEMSSAARPNFIAFMRNHFITITTPNKSMLQIRVPSEENALEAGLAIEGYKQTMDQMLNLDFHKLNENCDELIQKLSSYNHVIIETGEGHKLTLDYQDRKWYKDAGDGDFPPGEVYIAPYEDRANGTYKVDYIHWEGEHFKDVILTFEKGRLVASSVERIFEDLQQADAGALTLCEFGLGTNPNLTELTGHSLFDEKMHGSCHIAVGMNHLFGGTNESAAHVDFVSKSPKLTYQNE